MCWKKSKYLFNVKSNEALDEIKAISEMRKYCKINSLTIDQLSSSFENTRDNIFKSIKLPNKFIYNL